MPAFRPFFAGMQFGRLTVTRDRVRGEDKLLCRCSCGSEKWILCGSLTSGATKSCGCIVRALPNKVITRSDGVGEIRIKGGQYIALVDACDLEEVRLLQWGVLRGHNGKLYATSRAPGRPLIYMHRLVAGTPVGMETDHRDGDGLNNRRDNLRTATCSQNSANTWKPRTRDDRPHLSRFKGVTRAKNGAWIAKIGFNNRTTYLGRFPEEADAARAYDRAARAQWGEYALTNFPEVTAA